MLVYVKRVAAVLIVSLAILLDALWCPSGKWMAVAADILSGTVGWVVGRFVAQRMSPVASVALFLAFLPLAIVFTSRRLCPGVEGLAVGLYLLGLLLGATRARCNATKPV